MLGLIYYSKNRAMQLQASLDSLEINTRGMFNDIRAIYVATDSDYQKGYDILAERKPYLKMIRQEGDLKDLTINNIVHPYIMLAADDDIFYRPLAKNWRGMMTDDVECFSMRHGLNIDYCYPLARANPLKRCEHLGEFIKWRWADESDDWAYPLSTISHIFRSDDLISRTKRISVPIKNLNEYEGHLQAFVREARPYMVAWKKGGVFGVPANKVNDTHNNRSGLKYSYTIDELNKRYLAEEVIDIARMEFDINAMQQEVEYKFKKYGK